MARSACPCDEDVAQALEMGEDRHAGLLLHPGHEALPAARDDHVDRCRRGPPAWRPRRPGPGSARGGSRRRAARRPRGPAAMACGDRRRGPEAVGAGPQDGGVAGLEAERARVGRDVGAALEDDADHAERRRHALDDEAVGTLEGGEQAADRIGQVRHGFDRAARCPPAAARRGPGGRGRRASVLRPALRPCPPRWPRGSPPGRRGCGPPSRVKPHCVWSVERGRRARAARRARRPRSAIRAGTSGASAAGGVAVAEGGGHGPAGGPGVVHGQRLGSRKEEGRGLRLRA